MAAYVPAFKIWPENEYVSPGFTYVYTYVGSVMCVEFVASWVPAVPGTVHVKHTPSPDWA
ncbi:hypothetical protein GCM10028816_18060 [Spirosoma lituiforme]